MNQGPTPGILENLRQWEKDAGAENFRAWWLGFLNEESKVRRYPHRDFLAVLDRKNAELAERRPLETYELEKAARAAKAKAGVPWE